MRDEIVCTDLTTDTIRFCHIYATEVVTYAEILHITYLNA